MEIGIVHYNATKEIDYDSYFDLIEYENHSSLNLKKSFSQFISEREYFSWDCVLLGAPDLAIPERLHTLGEIDITNGLDVILTNNKEEFSDYCISSFLPNFKNRYSKTSIYGLPYDKSNINEYPYFGKEIFCLELYRQHSCKTIYVERLEMLYLDVPDSYYNKFKDSYLFCKKNDLENMFKFMKLEFKNEFKRNILSQFEEGKSIVEVEHY
jgi:hypothetical protein